MDNFDIFENVRDNFKAGDIEYPQMKIIDMGFWQIGTEKEK